MKMTLKGYTLIELVVTIALLVMVLVAGTAIFFRSLRSSGVSDVQTTVNNSVRAVSDAIENNIRYGKVEGVVGSAGYDRTECLSAGAAGVSGSTLVTHDISGGTSTYTRNIVNTFGVVSSNSGTITNPGIDVTRLEFKWICTSGVNDKINLLIEAKSTSTTESSAAIVSSKDINLLNSGID